MGEEDELIDDEELLTEEDKQRPAPLPGALLGAASAGKRSSLIGMWPRWCQHWYRSISCGGWEVLPSTHVSGCCFHFLLCTVMSCA
jgi:hypothetical protein